MNRFKVGDKVRRTHNNESMLPVGWEGVIGHVYAHGGIVFPNHGVVYDPKYFELVEEDTSKRRCHYAERIAHAEGAEIECQNATTLVWIATDIEPLWCPSTKYRVKPPAPVPTKQEVGIDRIEAEMRKLADDLKELKK